MKTFTEQTLFKSGVSLRHSTETHNFAIPDRTQSSDCLHTAGHFPDFRTNLLSILANCDDAFVIAPLILALLRSRPH
ncbi:hypothetical protein MTP99_002185 [Tenebrio molitor]|nr:hypothetical protein MTP99_002185 [Tenebrio molitor]